MILTSDQKESTTKFAIVIAAILIFVYVLSLKFCNTSPMPQHVEKKEKKDTVIKYIYVPQLIGEGKATVTPRKSIPVRNKEPSITILPSIADTNRNDIAIVEPFIARLDSIQDKDTLHLEYLYPESIFKWNLRRARDSVGVINTTVETTIYIDVPFYEKPAFVAPTTAAIVIALFLSLR